MNRYEANGEKRTSYDVLVENIEFLEAKGSGDSAGYEPHDYAAAAPASAPKPSVKEAEDVPFDDDDEFPF